MFFGLVNNLQAEEFSRTQFGGSAGYAFLSGNLENRDSFQVFFRYYMRQNLGVETSIMYFVKKSTEGNFLGTRFIRSESYLPVHFHLVYSPLKTSKGRIAVFFGGGIQNSFLSNDLLGSRTDSGLELVTGFSVDFELSEHLALQPRFTVALSPSGDFFARYGTFQFGIMYQFL
jgi:hypothetical protein